MNRTGGASLPFCQIRYSATAGGRWAVTIGLRHGTDEVGGRACGLMDAIEHPEALRGFLVRASDGRVGVVGDANPHSLVVRRAFRRRIAVPARAVVRIDTEGRTVFLDRTRRQVSRTPQRAGAGGEAWFIPASDRIPGAAVIGAPPLRDDEEPS